jgi:hypothetical protein
LTATYDVESILDVGLEPTLRCEAFVKCSDVGRGRRWSQTFTYRFAAVKLNNGGKIDGHVNASPAGCDE